MLSNDKQNFELFKKSMNSIEEFNNNILQKVKFTKTFRFLS